MAELKSTTIHGKATIKVIDNDSNLSNFLVVDSGGEVHYRTSGADGTSGTSGSSGNNGNNGNSGTSGTSGSSGNNGNNGNSGTSGTSGSSGNNGNNGNSGTSGTSGSSGNNGNNGNSGTSGNSGNNGNNGTSGTSGISATGSLADGTAAAPSLTFASDTNTGLYRYGVDTIGFSTAGALEMVLNANGNLGIGTASPTQLLDVNGKVKLATVGTLKSSMTPTVSTTFYLYPNNGGYLVLNPSSGITLTFNGQSSAWPSGYLVPFTLAIKYAGALTVNWNSKVLWSGGQAPALTATSGKADVFSLVAISSTLFVGSIIAQNIDSTGL